MIFLKRKELNIKDKVSLCGIAKNEASTIRRTLDSVENFVTSYYIGLDDSCSDGTDRIVKRWFKKRKKKGEVYYFKWENDFSKARNFGLKKATGDFILILDFHEYFPEESKKNLNLIFDRILSNVKFLYFSLLNFETGTKISQLRMFKRDAGLYFKNKVHNLLVGHYPEDSTLLEGLTLYHKRRVEDIKERTDQRVEMILGHMEKTLEENPKDVRSLFYLARQHILLKQWDKSIGYGKRYIEIVREPFSVAVALANMAICYFGKKDTEESIKYIDRAIEIHPSYPYPYILKAFTYMEKGDWDPAEVLVIEALKNNKMPMSFLPIPIAFYTWFPHFLMAQIKYEKKEYDVSKRFLDQARQFKKFFIGEENIKMDELERKLEQVKEGKIVLKDVYINDWEVGQIGVASQMAE